jgi:hypothetical protein
MPYSALGLVGVSPVDRLHGLSHKRAAQRMGPAARGGVADRRLDEFACRGDCGRDCAAPAIQHATFLSCAMTAPGYDRTW